MIAIFVKTYLPLSEVFIWKEIRGLKDFKAIVLTKKVENSKQFPIEWEITEEPIGKIHGFKRFFDGILLRTSIDIPYFRSVLVKHKVTLIHAHFAYGGMAILELSKELRLPLVTTLRGIDVSMFARHPLYKRRLMRFFHEGTLFLVQSEDMKQDVMALGCPHEKIFVHPSGIDIKTTAPRKHGKEKALRVLMCGRFVEKKGFEFGIEAFSNVVSNHREAELRIIGDGPLRKRLERQVRRLKLTSSVKFLGFLANDRVLQEMSKGDVFLCPSVTAKSGDKEGMPNVIKEAMATGLPVVSTWHAGIPELVKDGESGFLVDERDVGGLSNRLSFLLSDPELRRKMGNIGREIIRERFDLTQQIKKLEEIYKTLLYQ
jgi:glycosyltransferase involved in cell wall biosynthesis